MLMISLVLHGVVLMLPISSGPEMSKAHRKGEAVKITQLPTTRPSSKLPAQSASKPNPQPSPQLSRSTAPNQPTRPEPSSEPNLQLSPQLSPSTAPNQLTRPKPMTTRQEWAASPLPIREPSSPSQQQPKFKKEEPQQQLTEQPRRSPSTKQPAQSLQPNPQPAQSSQSNQQIAQAPSTQQPIQSPQPNQQIAQAPSTQQPIQSPQPNQEPAQSPSAKQPIQSPQPNQEPAQSPSAKQPTESSQPNQESTGKNDSIGGSYTDYLKKNQDDIILRAALAQVKQGQGDKLQDFKADRDLNKLTEPDKFKDTNGKPDTKFDFLQKAVSPLTTQDITSALATQLNSLEFRFDKKGTYGGGTLYEVTKGDFKRYVILAPGKDEQGEITAIIVLQDYPG